MCRRMLRRDLNQKIQYQIRIVKPSDNVRCAIFCIVISILFLAMYVQYLLHLQYGYTI